MGNNCRKIHKACLAGSKGEAPRAAIAGSELPIAQRNRESSKSTEHLMEEVCGARNLAEALKRVMQNKGSPGVDGMTVSQLPEYLRTHGPRIRQQLLTGRCLPQPVRQAEIPKPGGGRRKLGIPTVLDRLIQQAILQVLQPRWDKTFSDASFGFRPGRNQHQAIRKAQEYIEEGYTYVVDIDIEKFFDRVDHDKLMSWIAHRVKDKRLLKLLRRYLNTGAVMAKGVVVRREEGTPQGSPLSPLLSNLFLDKLDKELEERGHKFVRYADDCNIYVRSERAARRVKDNVSRFITRKLKLKVNEAKSAIGRHNERKFLSFRLRNNKDTIKRCIDPEAIKRFKAQVRRLTRRSAGQSLQQTIERLNLYLRGWTNYFGFCQTPSTLENLNCWIRRRLRCTVWKQWSRGRNTAKRRFRGLTQRGVSLAGAAEIAASRRGSWRMSHTRQVQVAFPVSYFRQAGLYPLGILKT